MSTPLRVVHLHTGREWGGGELQVSLLVRGLASRGVQAALWADGAGRLFARAMTEGLPVQPLPARWKWPLGDVTLGRDLARWGVDLLHCHDSGSLGLGIRLRRRLRVPLVLARRIASPLRANPVSRFKYSPRRVDAVIAISETVRDVFCRSGFPRARVSVVPSGLDIQQLDGLTVDESVRQAYGNGFLVAGIGKLAPKKNWPLLVRTAASVAASGLDVHWLLVGDGPERRLLEALVRELDVSSRVHLLGFREDASRILRSVDLLFFPSQREGASVTVRQAMVLGVPVVAANAPGIVESLGGHGWTVEPDDVAGATSAVVEALTNDSTRRRLCRAASASARERFGVERMVSGTLGVYAEVLHGRDTASSLRG